MPLKKSSKPLAPYQVALFFNANKIYDRGVIAGIGAYMRGTRADWDVFLEEDYRARISDISGFSGDGIIADFDDPSISKALQTVKTPIVAVGGSYKNPADYPKNIPYVATDNHQLVAIALNHLLEAGLSHFALYSLPESPTNRWAQEREHAFSELTHKLTHKSPIYRGIQTSAQDWNIALKGLGEWLNALKKPVGIVAITDARARHLLQACTVNHIAIPEEISIVGIDNDPLMQSFSRIGLSSVQQGTEEMGRVAASLLHQMLQGARLDEKRVIIPPSGITSAASSKHIRPYSAHVMKALYYLRQNACQGIRTAQVASFVGVSRGTLESSFRKELNSTIHDQLINLRINAARELLENTRLPTREIAKQCGFSSVQYLHTAFLRETGKSPHAYRACQ